MRFLSLFSGLDAASVAWNPLGWECAAFAEIEPFPCAVLAHRYPKIPNLGDVTKVTQQQIEALGHLDVVVFGSPCQDLSVAGKREGLKGKRSGLFFTAMQIVEWSRARWAVFENVPGLFSSNEGRDFAAVVGAMVGAEFTPPASKWKNIGCAIGPDAMCEWSVLDAQWFGVPQRRKRVFVVRDSGNWRDRPPVLFDSQSLCGNSPPSRETRKDVAPTISARTGGLGRDFDLDGGLIAKCLNAKGGLGRIDAESETFIPSVLRGHSDYGAGLPALRAKSGDCGGGSEVLVTHALRAEGFDASEDGTGRATPLIVIPVLEAGARTGKSTTDLRAGSGIGEPGDPMYTLQSGKQHAVAFGISNQPTPKYAEELMPTLNAHNRGGGMQEAVAFSCKDYGADAGEVSPTLRSMGHSESHANAGGQVAIAFTQNGSGDILTGDISAAMSTNQSASGRNTAKVLTQMAVRRLTPRECERLQGFPEVVKTAYTHVPYRGKPAADGPRYKALGNSMAVPVMAWIGKRIDTIDFCFSEEDDLL